MGVMDFNLFKKIVDEADEIGVGAITWQVEENLLYIKN